MKRRTCLLLLLLPALLQAQRNFQKAYIVTLQGDTINGWINYQEWGYTPAEILFKPDNGTSEIRHPAGTIQHETQPTPAVVQNDSYRRFRKEMSVCWHGPVLYSGTGWKPHLFTCHL